MIRIVLFPGLVVGLPGKLRRTGMGRKILGALSGSAVLSEAMEAASVGGTCKCFHCGVAVTDGSRWQAMVDGVRRRMCCQGCAGVAQAIADSGFSDYYATRTGYAAQVEAAADTPEYALYDNLECKGEAGFVVEGIRDAACVWLIERRLGQLPGVRKARMKASGERLHVRWDPALCRPSTIVRSLRAIGYVARPDAGRPRGEQLERERTGLLCRLFVAGLSMAQVMMYVAPLYLGVGRPLDEHTTALMRWASLVLTLPAVLYCAQPFFLGAWRDLELGLSGVDGPAALGIAAAFAGSCAALFTGQGVVYLYSVTMFVFMLLGNRYLELGTRRKAACALERLQQGGAVSALRIRGEPAAHDCEVIAASALRVGDLVLVKAGQAVPADGVIVDGDTVADLALLTGESRIQRRTMGDFVPAGAINAAQTVVLRVTSTATDSTLAKLVRLVERAGQAKPALALWADKVAAWSVLALLGLAVVVFFAWQAVDPSRAWHAAAAMLVVTSPCALSLATPTALAAASERLLRRGVLAVRPHTLETFERATHILFDKTGTLTRGRPMLRQAVPVGNQDIDACLRIAAALEAGNPHPIGQAICEAGGTTVYAAEQIRYLVGQGVEGCVNGRLYRLGSAAFVEGVAGGMARSAAPTGTTSVWLGTSAGWLARFDLSDGVRPEAAAVVERFRNNGKTVVLLSGDDRRAAQAVAAQLGITTALGGRLPEEKLAYVRKLQAGGAVVAMVGDGINDAAVLSGADVSFAMGRGAELAQLHADGVLLIDGLDPLADAADMARRTLAVIRQNFIWASVYSLVAIPAAASGLLNPWIAGVGMVASSALVVLNALRLRKG